MALVSVIIPVYNVEKFLPRCLDSVLQQTESDLEIICVNDGSPDRSAEILADYAARDSRIRIVTQENRGLSGARNAGLDVCTGEWVMFVDSDDWIPADAVRGFLQVAQESGAPVVASERYAVDAFDSEIPRTFHWTLQSPALKKLVGERKMQSCAWNKFYKASLLKTRRFIEGIYFEDWPFVTELFGDVDAFAKVKEPMYVYCLNDGETSIVRSAFTEKKAQSYRAGIRHVTEYFAGHPQKKYAMKRVAVAQKMLDKRLRKAGLLPKRSLAARIFPVHSTAKADKFTFLGIPVYKRKYAEGKIRHYLLGVPVKTDKSSVVMPVQFSADGFRPFDVDDTALLNELRTLGRFTFIPNPGNLGDMLITAAALQFFERHNLPYTLLSEAKKIDSSVVFSGGGIWIEEYEKGWKSLLGYAKNASKILILPSSFRRCDAFLKGVDSRFTIFCREEPSYEYLASVHTDAKVILDHDMAFRLKGDILKRDSLTVTAADRRALRELVSRYPFDRAVGRFMRRDCECAQNCESDVDLSYVFRASERASRSFVDFAACVMLSAVDGVSAVVTDRLHVSIAAALMGKEVYVLDNSYKKLSAVYRRTMQSRANVKPVAAPPQNLSFPQSSSPNMLVVRQLAGC